LFEGISRLFVELACVPDWGAEAIAFFLFGDWFPERLSRPPLLWITAPPTSAGAVVLQLLELVCRRSLRVADFSLSTLRRLPLWVGPTIFADPVLTSRAFLKTLHATSRPGSHVICTEGIIDLACARVISATNPPADPAAAGFPLEIALAPARGYIAPLGPDEAERIADDIQAKLLMYRIVNYAKLAQASIDAASLTLPMQQLAHDLALCIVDDDELRMRIVPLLQPRDREIRVERSTLLETIVVEALLAAAHDFGRDGISVLELTKMVNTVFRGRGESRDSSPEEVGWRLRGLGISRELMPGGRKGIVIDDRVREMIHRLARAYGIRSVRGTPADSTCRFCASEQVSESQGAEGTNVWRQLRY
jgi:hypothetical protein